MALVFIAVGIGSALGGMARFGIALAADKHLGTGFPWGTFIVNFSGSLLIGLLAVVFTAGSGEQIPHEVKQGVLVGLLGGFTTFSTFSFQTLALFQQDQTALAVLNIVASVAACLLGVAAGAAAGKGIVA